MPTLTQTRAMAHAHSLAALNATAKNAATKEEEKKKNDKKKEEEEQAKIQQASEEKKRDAARLKAAKATKKEAKKKEHTTDEINNRLMDLTTFGKDGNEEENDGASKILFDKEAGGHVPKRPKRSIGSLKMTQRYTKAKTVNLQQNTTYIDFGVTLLTNDKSGEFSAKVKDLLTNFQLLNESASLLELAPRNEQQPKIISQQSGIPSNFTQLGQFIVFSGEGIF